MPKAHQTYHNWIPQVFLDWEKEIGVGTKNFANEIVQTKPHPEHCARVHHGLKRLAKQYGKLRLEHACLRALAQQCLSFHSLESILKNGLDKMETLRAVKVKQLPEHQNLRGKNYYQQLNQPGE